MMKRPTLWIAILFMAFGMTACEGKKGNRQLKEAAEIHEDMMQRYDSLYHVLVDKRKEINARIDELPPEQRSANESMLRSIKKSLDILEGWEASVIGVPGYEFDYHHHHEEEGHEHHHHGRENDALLNGMNDKEVLEMQKALNTRFTEVNQEINILLETIKAYEAR